MEWLPPFEKALHDLATTLNDPENGFDLARHRLHLAFDGAFGSLHCTPRSLSSRLLSHMICLDGIVTSCSLVRPKLLRSVHWSEAGKTFLAKEYVDATMVLAGGTLSSTGNNSYPTEDDQKRRLMSEFGLSTYRDYQTISVQEMPERAPPGQLPRAVDVVLDGDLVDCVKPGDRARIVGIYRGMAAIYNGQVPGTFRAVLLANSVQPVARSPRSVALTDADIAGFRKLAADDDILHRFAASIAPSIYGHEDIKRAVLLQLLGGVERNLANGTHIRGDINIMLVGDPSTAKSQMLRFVLGIAPLAVATTGRGSSGVGLTAAVTSDKETGERRLEAGAMVLADRGVVCIDEFDKMSDQDRVAIHEVMEQQTVTIAKAGIHTTLNARCSVLAAANPVFGSYKESASPQENIRLPDSLLSRFDLMFIVLDKCLPETDRRIAEHVLRMHRHLAPGAVEGAVTPDKSSIYDYEQDDDLKGGAVEGDDPKLSLPFVKRYMCFAKELRPVLSEAATAVIVEAYCDFRQKREQSELLSDDLSSSRTFPVTARTLETLIRLATAHAKLRLSATVDRRDAVVARDLIESCLYTLVRRKPAKISRRAVKENPDGGGGDSAEASGTLDATDKGKDVTRGFSDFNIHDTLADRESSTQGTQPAPLARDCHDVVMAALNRIRASSNDSFISMDRLRAELAGVSVQDIEDCLFSMQDANMLMYRDDFIILI